MIAFYQFKSHFQLNKQLQQIQFTQTKFGFDNNPTLTKEQEEKIWEKVLPKPLKDGTKEERWKRIVNPKLSEVKLSAKAKENIMKVEETKPTNGKPVKRPKAEWEKLWSGRQHDILTMKLFNAWKDFTNFTGVTELLNKRIKEARPLSDILDLYSITENGFKKGASSEGFGQKASLVLRRGNMALATYKAIKDFFTHEARKIMRRKKYDFQTELQK